MGSNALKSLSHFVLPNLGFVGGTTDGLIQGRGLGGSLREGVGSGLEAAGSIVGGETLGPIFGKTIGSTLGGALGGAGAGGISNGASGIASGALRGGIGGYLSGGGLGQIGDAIGLTGNNGLLGTSAGTPLANGVGPTQGSGILGTATRGLSDFGSALGIGGGGGSTYSGGPSGSSYGGLATLLSGANSINANDNAKDDLLSAQRKALSRYQPYVDAKFTPGDLTQDPGYQFQLQQGDQALGRQESAKGGYFSGAALKAAQDYGQGLAGTTYNNAYNRWLQQNNQNIGVAGDLSGLDQQGGNVRANAGIANSNVLNRGLSSLLNGYGAYSNTGAPLGQTLRYDPRTGQPIYA